MPFSCGLKRVFNGSGGWIRTSDQLINSQLRYHCATPEHAVPSLRKTGESISHAHFRGKQIFWKFHSSSDMSSMASSFSDESNAFDSSFLLACVIFFERRAIAAFTRL